MSTAQHCHYYMLPLLALLLVGCDQMGGNAQQQDQGETAVAEEQSTGSQAESKNTSPTNSATANNKQAAESDNASGWTEPEAEARQDTDNACSNCGTISAIEPVAKKGDSSGIGIVAGGVAGGIIGNQIGGGTGKKIATVAGAIGGAFAGNEVEKYINADKYYAVTVDMANGGQQTLKIANGSDLFVGQKVRLEGNNIYLRQSQ